MNLDLPLHPTNRHPLTGAPLRAVWVRPDGRPVWPILGGDDTVPPADAPPETPPAAPPAATPADLGFPANTPVVEMTLEQQVAYHRHQSRKHEERATEYRTAAGGKTAAEVRADLEAAEAARVAGLSAQEQALETAKQEARQNAAREYAPKAARTAFEFALSHLKDEDRAELIDTLDLTKVITDSGDVDTAKVRSIVEKIAPADKGTGGRQSFDFGAGNRGDGAPKAGVSAGADLFAASRKKSTQPTS